MPCSTKQSSVRSDGIHVGRDGLSYAFAFDIEGHHVPTCDFCGATYRSQGLQVSVEAGLEICPSCIAAGPLVVAKALEGNEDLKEAREVFERLASFEQLPGGIVALKVAEGYRETKDRGTTIERSRLRREV